MVEYKNIKYISIEGKTIILDKQSKTTEEGYIRKRIENIDALYVNSPHTSDVRFFDSKITSDITMREHQTILYFKNAVTCKTEENKVALRKEPVKILRCG